MEPVQCNGISYCCYFLPQHSELPHRDEERIQTEGRTALALRIAKVIHSVAHFKGVGDTSATAVYPLDLDTELTSTFHGLPALPHTFTMLHPIRRVLL